MKEINEYFNPNEQIARHINKTYNIYCFVQSYDFSYFTLI